MAALTRRPAGDDDLQVLFEIFRSTREEEFARAPWSDEERAAFFRQQFSAQHAHYQKHYVGASFELLLVDDAPAGRLYVYRNGDDIRVVDIALLPAHRNSGIGSRLFRELFDEADREGKRVSIHVELHNPARRLYERLGFAAVEEKGVYVLMERAPRV